MVETFIDIGSNSIKYICIDKSSDSYKLLLHGNLPNRISNHILTSQLFSEEDIQNTALCLHSIKDKSSVFHSEEYYAVGTMAFRKALNADEMCETVFQETGIKIQILKPEEEALLSYQAVIHDFPDMTNSLIFNIGGGSTEFIYSHDTSHYDLMSLDIGAVVLKNKFMEDTKTPDILSCISYLEDQFLNLPDFNPQRLIGSGGTISSALRLAGRMKKYDFQSLHHQPLTLIMLDQLITILSTRYHSGLILEEYIPASHADILLPGLLIVRQIMILFHFQELTSCEKGLVFALIDYKDR